MIDHIGIPVSDVARSKQFFVAALAPLGYKVIMDVGEAVGMGAEAGPDFWFGKAKPGSPSSRDRGRRTRQRKAGHSRAIPSELLRRIRVRSGRQQHRSRMP
jgi:catechol 2,3-dioxygenase-like lactoylglutathione lyase family enzyme